MDYSKIELTDYEDQMIYYYFYHKRGYNHMEVDGDIFRPEIVRAVANIEYQIEDLREKDREAERKRQQALGTNNKQRVPINPYVKR